MFSLLSNISLSPNSFESDTSILSQPDQEQKIKKAHFKECTRNYAVNQANDMNREAAT